MQNQQNDIDKKDTYSYKSILKSTSLFGGVQVYKILIGIVLSKFVAVLLGPVGVGIRGLLQSSIQMIEGITSLGLSRSAVRDVSLVYGTGNHERIGRVVASLKKLVWATGVLGMLTTMVLSPILSKIAFGNYDYTIPFIILSITLLFNQLSAGQLVILQGMRRLKYLANASAIGVTVGLVLSVPLYYWLGVKGIVPTLILNSFTSLLLSWFFSRKISINKVSVTKKEAIAEGRTMIKMGLVMSISSVLSLLFAYLLRGFIRQQSDIESVGVFTAGFAILNTYVGLIFDAMIKDFYPRLSSVSNDNAQCRLLVNQQGEIATLIMSPLLTACLIFMPFIILLLYSNQFLGAVAYIYFSIPGMFFKLASWAIALIFVAKGSSKLYMSNEILGNTTIFVCSIAGFYFWGMKGLGIGFSLGFLIYFAKVWWTAQREYDFSFSVSFWRLFLIQFFLVLSCLLVVLIFDGIFKFVTGGVLLIISTYFSLIGLNKRTDLLNSIKTRIGHGKK